MSTPLDPNQPRQPRRADTSTQRPQGAPPQHAAPVHGADLRKDAPSPQGQPGPVHQGQPMAGAPVQGQATPGQPMQAQGMAGQPGMSPQQHPLDSGAPNQARLPQRLGDDGKNTPISFGRLVSVELRKTLDTRAGKWLLGCALVLMLAICIGMSFTSGVKNHPEFGGFLGMSALGLKFILPIIGVMAVTSEWSQRTGLVTFALEPRRTRVGLAKWFAALILGAVVIAFTVALAALLTVVVSSLSGHDADWGFGFGRVLYFALIFLLFVSMGVAFGLLIQNTPAAICAFLFLPIAFSIITSFPAIHSVGEWADPNQNLFALLNDDGDQPMDHMWPKIIVGQLIWLALPMVLGFIRLNKREVKSS